MHSFCTAKKGEKMDKTDKICLVQAYLGVAYFIGLYITGNFFWFLGGLK